MSSKLLVVSQGYFDHFHERNLEMVRTDMFQTARGAILTFLLLQMTNSATDGKVGTLNPFSEYVKFLPARIPIPTLWNDEERLLLTGTSLEAAVESKLKSLDREFTLLREKTTSIDWCRQYWWDTEIVVLTFDDWKQVDAMYRSRALDLPGTGHAMVPCIDMANHASGDDTTALYDTDDNGNAVLVLRDDKNLIANDEVTITYGDEKGACEMLFSYGFIESTMKSARELFLDLEIPDDDPLKLAKKAVSNTAPGFRLFVDGDSVGWEGSFVWLIVVNEEDGLEFKLLQNTNGERELQASWKDEVVPDMSKLQTLAQNELLWDVFNLRAVTTLQYRIEQQLIRLEGSKKYIDELLKDDTIEQSIRDNARRLRESEEALMLRAYDDFESKVVDMAPSKGCSLLIQLLTEGRTFRIVGCSELPERSIGTERNAG